ncbi:hypothetical protein N7539_003171 [Penicillium diatomitis]|uniref:Uncharacterized protein n=1 Tax=Penicillium diatomitis TaxID=2819901 RepID=A0A9W9XG55_9EURO|nr:uncharacterized protein N7539_003171 [Penicillium diatomitis]KAJ5491604.1 hypothetical protein N7539_003171 [Penicillium diatomitis]
MRSYVGGKNGAISGRRPTTLSGNNRYSRVQLRIPSAAILLNCTIALPSASILLSKPYQLGSQPVSQPTSLPVHAKDLRPTKSGLQVIQCDLGGNEESLQYKTYSRAFAGRNSSARVVGVR